MRERVTIPQSLRAVAVRQIVGAGKRKGVRKWKFLTPKEIRCAHMSLAHLYYIMFFEICQVTPHHPLRGSFPSRGSLGENDIGGTIYDEQ